MVTRGHGDQVMKIDSLLHPVKENRTIFKYFSGNFMIGRELSRIYLIHAVRCALNPGNEFFRIGIQAFTARFMSKK